MKKPIPFGKYCLIERISIGGMAEVFKAKTFGVQGFSKIIAIKRILPSMADDKEFVTMFIDEAKIAVQLNHANICQIYELGKINKSHYIAMEYIHGKDLLQLQNRFKRDKMTMPVEMACYTMQKVCEGLDYAHRKRDANFRELNLVHRDISPQNIILSFDGEVKIIDFGIAKASTRSTRTQVGVLKGKFGYMSPEQVRGLVLDRRSDIFAAGTVLYEILSGKRLFVADSDFATLEKVRKVDIDSPGKVIPGMTAQLEAILLKALAREREERYQWARELGEDLAKYLQVHHPGYTAKSLADWMRSAYSSELEEEKRKMEVFASITSPEDLLDKAVQEASSWGSQLPEASDESGQEEAEACPQPEEERTSVFAYNVEADLPTQQPAVEGDVWVGRSEQEAAAASSWAEASLEEEGAGVGAGSGAGMDEDVNEDVDEDEGEGASAQATETFQAISDEEYARLMDEAAFSGEPTSEPLLSVAASSTPAPPTTAFDPARLPFPVGRPLAPLPSSGTPAADHLARFSMMEDRGTMDLSVEDLLAGELIEQVSQLPPAKPVSPPPGKSNLPSAPTVQLDRQSLPSGGAYGQWSPAAAPHKAAVQPTTREQPRATTPSPAVPRSSPEAARTPRPTPEGPPPDGAAGAPGLPSLPWATAATGSEVNVVVDTGSLPAMAGSRSSTTPDPSSREALLALGHASTLALDASDIPAPPSLPHAAAAQGARTSTPLSRPGGAPAARPGAATSTPQPFSVPRQASPAPRSRAAEPADPGGSLPSFDPSVWQEQRPSPPSPVPGYMTAAHGKTPIPATASAEPGSSPRPRSGKRGLVIALIGIALVAPLLLGGLGYAGWTLLLGPWLSRTPTGEASLSLTASPDAEGELSVLLDGEEVGKSLPLTLEGQRGGRHELKITSSQYATYSATIELSPQGLTEHKVRLTVSDGMMARLKLRLPEGEPGQVLVDGRKIKEEPAEGGVLELRLPPGVTHRLEVKRSGFVTHRSQITLAAQEQRDELVEWVALEGEIQLASEPSRANVILDDKKVGTTPFTVRKLSPGKSYDLRLTKPGFEEWQDDVSFDGDHPVYSRTVELIPSGEPAPGRKPGAPSAGQQQEGYLTVSAGLDSLARVFVDGIDTGKSTPISEFSKIALPPGEHVIGLKAGGKMVEEKVIIEPGKTYRLKVKLR